ncbi:MAG: sugar transferase [Anaerolineae bacterium]
MSISTSDHNPVKMSEHRVMKRLVLSGLGLHTSERKLMLLTVDLLLINAVLLVSVWIGWDMKQPLESLLLPYKWYITLTAVWVVVGMFFDIYDLARSASTFNIMRSVGSATLITVLIYSLIPSLTPTLQSRTQIFVFIGLALVLLVTWRVTYSQLFIQPFFHRRALIVGAGWAGQTLASALQMAPNDANPFRGTGYQMLGFIDDNPSFAGSTIEGIPVLGGQESLVPMAHSLHVDEVVVAITHRHAINDALFDDLLRCSELGIQLSTMSDVYERLLGRVPVQHVGRDLYMAMPSTDSPYHRLYNLIKRFTDIISTLPGMIFLAIVIPFVWLANRLGSPGPLFYQQTRVGRGGKPFQVVKFRSMIPDAEARTGAVWAASGDHRVTPVGRFLRRTRLDELPQFINVMRGEMSLIGPRPERPEFVEQLAQTIPFYRARHAMRPGLTGWAQIQYSYGNSVDDARIKLEYDLYYVKHCSALLDLRIALQTIPVMLLFKGH